MEFKVMVIYRFGERHVALTSQLLEFSSAADAEKAIKAVRKTNQAAVDTHAITFIRFYEVNK